MPSGHITITTAMLVSVFYWRKARYALGVVLVLEVLSVLYLGLHWPLDVVFGLLLGAAMGWLARVFFERTYEKEGQNVAN
jgi:undecaprenyl-diphosphatase